MIDSTGSPTAEIMTAEQLERLHLPNKSTELVRGRLVVREPPGTHHGKIAGRLITRVGGFVDEHRLGEVFGQDTGFKIASNPDTVRAPDLAFIARDRLSQLTPRGYASIAPDLVAEILSPDDRPREVIAKVGEWLTAQVRLVWVIDPERQIAQVHRSDGSLSLLDRDAALDGEIVLPGFRYALKDLLREHYPL